MGWIVTLLVASGALLLLVGFSGGLIVERMWLGPDRLSERDRIDQVAGLIETEYVGVPLDPAARRDFAAELERAAIQGMIGALDEYSAYLPLEDNRVVTNQLQGEYQGIGVWIDFRDGEIVVISAMPGSPAEEAGLRAGDVIESADGHPLMGLSSEGALSLVRGPENSFVTLVVRRAETGARDSVSVQRRSIPIHSVLYQLIPGTTVAQIKVSIFADTTTAELDEALARATADGATGIVLDLRNNGGGWVTAAQEMIGRFVPAEAGAALFEDEGEDSDGPRPEPILEGAAITQLPTVVLVNGGTASASEIVAGALQDYGRAMIVGEPTFGKGSVQRIHQLDDGSSVRITFATWLTPDRHLIEGVGIALDQAVAADPEASAAAGVTDRQLMAAVDLVKLDDSLPVQASPAASPVAFATTVMTPDAVPSED
jgi:carboxyl-terminal processing protease